MRTKPLLSPDSRENIGHIKSEGSQVVGPGCIHPNGNPYAIEDDVPFATTATHQKIHEVLADFLVRRAKRQIVQERGYTDELDFPILSIPRIVDGLQIHPVHGSRSDQKNLNVDARINAWYCHACQSGGGPLHLLAVMEDIVGCWETSQGALRGDRFRIAKALALEQGLIRKPEPPKSRSIIETVRNRLLSVADDNGRIAIRDAAKVAADLALEFLGPFASMQDTEEIFHYNNGVFHEGGEGVIARVVEDWFQNVGLGSLCTNQLVTETLGHVKRRTSTARELFDTEPFIFNLKNGLLDIRTFECKPHTSDYLSLVQLPISFDQNADCPLIKKSLREWLYPEDMDMVQESVGICLDKRPSDKALLAWGTGHNGKSTFLRLVKRLLGNENISAVSLQDLENDRFAASQLYGKLANIHADLSDAALKATGKFKMTTGGDPIAAQKKFKDHFTFVSYAKQFYSCNKIPEVPGDDTDAFFRRWNIITFPNKFEEERDDKSLFEKLSTEPEMSGFLNWAIEGLRRLQKNGMRFSNAKSTEEVRREYTLKSSPLKSFVMQRCELDPDAQVPKQELFTAFAAYCREKKMPVVTAKTFFSNLPREVNVSTHQFGRVWHFKGIRLKTQTELEEYQKGEDGADA